MNVARQNELIVNDISGDGSSAMEDSSVERLNSTYTLNILNEKEATNIPLQFRGTQTVLDIKTNVYTITNIAARHQEWIGWPPDTKNETFLGLTGIPLEHNLTLRSTEGENDRSSSRNRAGTSSSRGSARGAINEPIEIDSDSSVDEFEDASDFNGEDDIFTSTVANNRLNHLSK